MHTQYDILKTNLSGIYSKTQTDQKIGAVAGSYTCLQLSGPDDFIRFQCPDDIEEGILVLELEELHQKADAPFSYRILVNDAPAYLRTMEPVSSTLNPCFVKLRLQGGDVITIRNNASAPVRFAEIFLHTDLDAIQEAYQEPMEIGLCFPRFTYQDPIADKMLMCRIRDDFADLKHYTIAIGVEVKYMLSNDTQLTEQFRYILNMAAQTRVNLIFNFNSWWDGTPDGRDGKGGYFGDMEYQQVVYDPITGKKLLSIPNIWRHTPWYTMNHDHLNQVRKERLARTLDILGLEMTKLRASLPSQMPRVRLFIDNEPTYWAEFAYTASPESGGDFNEHAIAAAAGDGVDLEPRGDLTHAQKEWLVGNLCTYMTDISETYHRESSKEYALVTGGETLYSDHHLTENIFTHTMPYTQYPYADGGHLHYEEHVNPWTRLGVETNGFQDERVLGYMNTTGRYAQVNAERCCYNTSDFHTQFYAHGAVCDIIFNYFYDTDKDDLHRLDDLAHQEMPVQTFGVPVMSWRGYDGQLMGGEIIASENMEVAPLRERRVLRPATLGKGFITFSMGKASDYPYGGWLEITGLIRPDNGKVTLSLGNTPDRFPFVRELPSRDVDYLETPLRVSLSEILAACSHTEADSTLYLRLDFENLYYDDWAQMNSIWKIRAVAGFRDTEALPAEKVTTAGMPPAETSPDGTISAGSCLPLTLLEARALSLMLSHRMDCKRLSAFYHLPIPKTGNAGTADRADSSEADTTNSRAADITNSGAADITSSRAADTTDYKAAYEQLMHEISVQNTDKFLIQESGYLGKYDLYVSTAQDAEPILLQLKSTETGMVASLSGAPGRELTLQTKHGLLQAEALSCNTYTLSVNRHSGLDDDAATWTEADAADTLTLTLQEEPMEPYSFTGTFLGYDSEKQQITVTTHDTAHWNRQPSLFFRCEDTVPVTLVPSKLTGDMLEHISTNPYTPAAIKNARIPEKPDLTSLHPGDGLTLVLKGDQVMEIQAVRGLARGKLIDIVPVSISAPMHNAFLTLETAPGVQATFELGMKTHLNYKRAHAENPLLAGELDLELKKDCIVLISFEPESIKNNCYRALEVTLV